MLSQGTIAEIFLPLALFPNQLIYDTSRNVGKLLGIVYYPGLEPIKFLLTS